MTPCRAGYPPKAISTRRLRHEPPPPPSADQFGPLQASSRVKLFIPVRNPQKLDLELMVSPTYLDFIEHHEAFGRCLRAALGFSPAEGRDSKKQRCHDRRPAILLPIGNSSSEQVRAVQLRFAIPRMSPMRCVEIRSTNNYGIG
jgi:hypothetical protein